MQRLWMNVRQLLRSDHYRYSLVYWMIWVWLFLSLQLVVSANALAQSQSANPLREASSESSEKSVGSIRNFTGLVSLQSAEGKNKIANVGTRLFVGDIINTQKDSTVVLVFVDKTQVALRPKTRFVVEEYAYQPDNPIADKADFKLVQGGLRTLTGLIGKRSNTDAFQMRSQTATIGIRGTDFSARVCQGDECKRLASSEKGSASETNNSTVGAAGRVSQVMGQVSAINPAGQTRQLERGAAVFSGDKLTVNKAGFAVLVMADSSRMTLPGGSELEIAAFNYEPTEPKASVASFKLLAGGLRSVTGAIGKNQPDNVKFATQTATIGIRGTEINFGIVPPGAPPPALPGDVVLQVISGNVLLTNAAGQSVALLAGQFATVSGTNFPQVLTNAINIQQLIGIENPGPPPSPQPGETPDTFEGLSTTKAQDLPSSGQGEQSDQSLLVAVYDGQVVISGDPDQPPIQVSRGQGAFLQLGVTGGAPQTTVLQAPPQVLAEDTTLAAPAFQPAVCAP